MVTGDKLETPVSVSQVVGFIYQILRMFLIVLDHFLNRLKFEQGFRNIVRNLLTHRGI